MNKLRYIILVLVVIGSIFYSRPALAFETTTVSELMDVLKEQKQEAAYNIKLNAPFDKESCGVREDVSTETGEVSVNNTILDIPGRGLNLTLNLEYRSRDAKAYDEGTKSSDMANNYGQTVIAFYDVFDPDGYWLRTGALRYTTAYTTIVGETTIDTETWVFNGYLQYEDGTSLLVGSHIANTTKEKSKVAEAMHIFGEGWSLKLPWLDIDGDRVYVNLSNGKTYSADFNQVTGLKNYELSDIQFTKDTTSGNGNDDSAYKLYYVDGHTYYFSDQGDLLLESDRFNNNIRYYWEDVKGKRLLTKIIDTIGRPVQIYYSDNATIIKTDDQTVRLLKSALPGIPDKFYLAAYIDPAGREFRYKYTFADSAFDAVGKTPADNVYANLITIRYPTGAETKYVLDKSKKGMGDSGYMEYFKTVERKDQDGKRTFNLLKYQYYNEPDGYPKYNTSSIDETYNYYSKVLDTNGVTTRYVYNSKHLLYLKDQRAGQLLNQTTTTYHTTYNLPIRVDTKNYNTDGKANTKVNLYEYDGRGNKISENHPESPQTINSDAHKTFYSYDYFYNLLKSKEYKQDQDTTIEEKSTVSADKKNITAIEIRSNGDLVDNRKFTYDDHGNVTNFSVQKNADEWANTRYEYAEEYKGAYQTAEIKKGVKDADGNPQDIKTTISYDFNNGHKLSQTDGNSNTSYFEYDKLGRQIKSIQPDNTFTTINYDDQNNRIQTIDANGNSFTYQYDGLGRPQNVRETGKTTSLVNREYDNNGVLISEQDGNKNLQKMVYDKLNRITGVSHFDKYGNKLAQTLIGYDEAYYDRFGKSFLTLTIRKLGNEQYQTTKYYFDVYGLMAKQGRIHNGQEELAYAWYDYRGNNIQTIDFAGNKTTSKYNSKGRLLEQTDPEGQVTNFTYDMMGNQATQTDALGQTAFSDYDSLGRKVKTQVPFDQGKYSVNKVYYDGVGNLVKTIDAEGYETINYYNERNLLTAVEQPIGPNHTNLTKFEYDRQGNLVTLEKGLNGWNDPDFSTNTYQYDSLNRLIKTVDPEYKLSTYDYDNNGNLIERIDRNGVVTGYSYDGLNRVIRKQNSKEKTMINGTYDSLGNLRQISDASGTTQYEYDDLGRLLYINYGNGMRQKYAYDNSDRINQMQVMQGGLDQIDLKYEYDRAGRLTAVNDKGQWFKYQYDEIGRLIKELNGVTGTDSEYSYYPSGNIKSLRHFNSNELVADYEYIYDLRGNQIQKDEGPNTTKYYYDALSRIKVAEMPGDVTQNYEYDDFNNISEIGEIKGNKIKQTNFTYDRNNRLLLSETVSGDNVTQDRFEYDAEGNETYKGEVEKQNGDLVASKDYSFWYNGYNQLSRVEDPNHKFIEYTYNGQGLRTKKDSLDQAVNYYYDRGNIILESDQDYKVTAKNIRGLQLIYRETDDQTLYYLHNAHGDVTKILNDKGWVIKDYDYDPFGREETAPLQAFGGDVSNTIWRNETTQIDNPFRYCGEYLDEETGNYYLRARYYDPEARRFTTEDSYKGNIGKPLSLNWYSYCHNDPINFVDPSGNTWVYDGNQWNFLYIMANNPDEDEGNRQWAQDQLDREFYYKWVDDTIWEQIKQIPSTVTTSCSDTLNNTVPQTIEYLKSDQAQEAYIDTIGTVATAHVITFSMVDLAAATTAGGMGATAIEEVQIDLSTRPTATNQKLQNIINNLYKGQSNPTKIGNGTTMDAIRAELQTGNATGGKFHFIKGQESINGLQNLLNKGALSVEDAGTARSLIQDLTNALNGK